jgi:hypothetical protein
LGKATPVETSDRISDRGDRTSAGLTIASRNARDDQEAQTPHSIRGSIFCRQRLHKEVFAIKFGNI